jgi:hypothetical protein
MEQLPLPLTPREPRGADHQTKTPDPPAPLEPAPATRTFDPTEMALRGRIGAYRLHATHDPRETTQKARETFLARFEREVDPDGTLPEDERRRRAEYARRAYFAQLARSRRPGHRHHRGAGRRAAGQHPRSQRGFR